MYYCRLCFYDLQIDSFKSNKILVLGLIYQNLDFE